MKQMNKVIAIVTFVLSLNVHATAQFSFTCPEKFIATVVNVEDVQATTFPKIEVSFQVIQNLKGEAFESKKIQVVKDGPVEFKTGQTYTVETRDKWLCNASVLTSKI